MRKRQMLLAAIGLLTVAIALPAGVLAQHDLEGDPVTDHLIGPGEEGKIEFVAKVDLEAELGLADGSLAELIADLAVSPDGDFAYLANWGDPNCPFLEEEPGNEAGGRKASDAGVYVIDISDLLNPEYVSFIPMSQDTRPGEGMQVISVDTAEFTGDILAVNEESCGKNFKAGFSLWDVTDPTRPKRLAKNFGDFTTDGARNTPRDANQTHSVFMWTTGENTYLVAQDEMETSDVDIFDITDPKHPVLIAEVDANDFNVTQPELGLSDSFLHDVVVKQIEVDGVLTWVMLLSYWDGGWVLLDVDDPANPLFLADTDYAAIDPLLLEKFGIGYTLPPEGNAHQAEFTSDNRFIIGTDEDFSPYRGVATTDDGDEFFAIQGSDVPGVPTGGSIEGDAVYVGRACPGDAAVPEAPDTVSGTQIAIVERGVCTFQEKYDAIVEAGGYEAIIVMNREGADACGGLVFMAVAGEDVPALFVTREVGYGFFDLTYDDAACMAGDGSVTIAGLAIGAIGDFISMESTFDGWGYVHLIDAATLEDVDQFAIPEALDPAFAEGFGDLSVHEVAVDPQDPSLAYLAYYSGGLIAVQIQCPAGTPYDPDNVTVGYTSTCELVEVGSYLDPLGNNFWGVETFVDEDPLSPYFGRTIILASDRDSGLWIFVDP